MNIDRSSTNIWADLRKHLRETGLLLKIGYFLTAPLFLFLIFSGLAPLGMLHELEQSVKADSTFTSRYDRAYDNPELMPVIRERSYKEALIKLSENDSINLIVNLNDSVICLAIHGVIIHQTRIQYMKVDPLLKRMPNLIYTGIFSQTLPVVKEKATIVKEPIVVRQAPKDTLEAFLNAYQPDTLIQNPAFLEMKLEHNIRLIFEQDSNPSFHDKRIKYMFRAGKLLGRVFKNIEKFCTFKRLEYSPAIIIKIPVDDLRAVFSALPENPYLVLYYN